MASQALSKNEMRRLIIALASAPVGNSVADKIEAGNGLAGQSGWSIAAAIVATSTSTTTNFAALAVGDKIVAIPAVAGTAYFETVVTAGTKPSAATIGNLYVVLRAFSAPTAHALEL
jgi:hypothetical protein